MFYHRIFNKRAFAQGHAFHAYSARQIAHEAHHAELADPPRTYQAADEAYHHAFRSPPHALSAPQTLSRKRRLSEESEYSGMRDEKRRRIDERRLIGDHRHPADATSIPNPATFYNPQYNKSQEHYRPAADLAIPALEIGYDSEYDPVADWNPRPPARATASNSERVPATHRKPFKALSPQVQVSAQQTSMPRGFQPTNTLNQSSLQAQKRPFWECAEPRIPKPNPVGQRGTQQYLLTAPSKGSNVRDPRTLDDADDFGAPQAKRQKMDATRTSKSAQIDLTNEDEKDSQVDIFSIGAQVERRRLSSSQSDSQRTGSGTSRPNHTGFQIPEFRAVDDRLNYQKSRKHRRQANNALGASQPSAIGSPASNAPEPSQVAAGQRHSRYTQAIEELERPSPAASQSHTPLTNGHNGLLGPEGPSQPRGSQKQPAIDLDKDMPTHARETQVKKPKQGSKQDLKGVNDVFAKMQGGNVQRESVQPARRSIVQKDSDASLRSHVPSGSARGKATYDEPANVAPVFKRNKQVASEQPRVKARERMQGGATKRHEVNKHGNFHDAGEDELAGDKNAIRGSASRQASPAKTKANMKSTTNARQDRGSPMSRLKPTQFTSTGSHGGMHQRPADQSVDLDDDIMPMVQFFATSCLLFDGPMHLVYDHESRFIFVHQGNNDTPETIAGKAQAVAIGALEAREVVHHADCALVYLKGSMTSVSSGGICIAFKDHDGVKWLQDRLHAINEGISFKGAPSAEHVVKTFHNKVSGIVETTKRAKRSAKTQVAPVKAGIAALQRQQESRARERQPREDRIIYEDEASPIDEDQNGELTGVLARKEAREHRLERQQDGEQSRYFSDQPRKSTRETKPSLRKLPTPEKWTHVNKLAPWPNPVVYPPEGIRKVTVVQSDLEKLDDGEFLNDSVISFALRKIEEEMPPQHKSQVHFFNTFFYSALTSKNGKKALNYDAVKRWTKSVDLFDKPFVVVPINLDLHWFVAIICNLDQIPRKVGGVRDDEEDAAGLSSAAEPKSSAATNGQKAQDEDAGPTAQASSIDGRPDTAESGGGKKKRKPGTRTYPKLGPVIMTLDSFGATRSGECKYLKEYLKAEALDKRQMGLEIQDIQGLTAKGIPQQPNFCDCGVYLLGYIAEFAKNPRRFVSKVLDREMEETEFAGFNPSETRASIRTMLLELQEQQESDKKEQKKGRKLEKCEQKLAAKASAGFQSAPASKAPTPAPSSSQAPPAASRDPTPVQASEDPKPPAPASVRRTTPAETEHALPNVTEDDDEYMEMAAPRALGEFRSPKHGIFSSSPQSTFGNRGQQTGVIDDHEMLDAGEDLAQSSATVRQAPSSPAKMAKLHEQLRLAKLPQDEIHASAAASLSADDDSEDEESEMAEQAPEEDGEGPSIVDLTEEDEDEDEAGEVESEAVLEIADSQNLFEVPSAFDGADDF